jgi:ketosteroid isomerase-like protein
MRTPARRCGVATIIAWLFVAIFVHGCEHREMQPPIANAADIDRNVLDLLDRWKRAFEARDLVGVRSVLAVDDRFVWLEDGEPRYRNADDIVRAYASFPKELSFTHTLLDIRIVPISSDTAWAHLATSTKIEHSGRVVSEFTGVVLMITRRDAAGWKIHAAHSSTSIPRSPAPG